MNMLRYFAQVDLDIQLKVEEWDKEYIEVGEDEANDLYNFSILDNDTKLRLILYAMNDADDEGNLKAFQFGALDQFDVKGRSLTLPK